MATISKTLLVVLVAFIAVQCDMDFTPARSRDMDIDLSRFEMGHYNDYMIPSGARAAIRRLKGVGKDLKLVLSIPGKFKDEFNIVSM